MKYLFQLGREPKLSAAELTAVFSLFSIPAHIEHTRLPYAIVDSSAPLDIHFLMERLGGILKIGEATLGDPVTHLLQAQPEGKILFSLSGDATKTMALSLKKELTHNDRSVRYIEPKNTATILHNDLVKRGGDLTILPDQTFVTRAIQPIEEFGERDYGRPARDARSGMLPPKLAKIMVNLAGCPAYGIILDPFCGSGTILMEAALMGYNNLIGADISEKAIVGTDKNLKWLQQENPNAKIQMPKLIRADARKIDKKLPPHSVNAIVTEPYLGKPLRGNETKNFLEAQAKELEVLYVQTLESLKKILKPGGTIVFATPAFRHQKEWMHLRMPFPKPPMTFARPDQRVGRDIWKYQSTS